MSPHEAETKQSSAATILIVDDTPGNIALLSSMLLERGYAVKVATNGRRALTIADASPPDLVMLDVNMPEMDGYDVCRALKSSAATASIPVIFLSANDDVGGKVMAFRAGGVDYVTKPFQVEEVLARLETQLKIARLARALEKSRGELLEQNRELARRNHELSVQQRRTDLVFSALSDALSGRVLDGKYRLEQHIGAGGFGAVFRAEHLGIGRKVAVKVFRPSPGNDSATGLARFRREGMTACRIDHPNVVAVLDSGITDAGIAYLVMELLDGHSLARELRDAGALSVARAAAILAPVCDVLAAAAERGVFHRDIKPDNVLLHRERGVEVVKVVDFGIAKLLGESPTGEDANLTMTGAVVGSPAYMSPERLLGHPSDASADVYSVGVILYQAIAGRLPFEPGDGSFTAIALRYLTQEPPRVASIAPGVPSELDDLVALAMAKVPAQRPSAVEVAQRLRELSRGAQKTSAPPAGPSPPALTVRDDATTERNATAGASPRDELRRIPKRAPAGPFRSATAGDLFRGPSRAFEYSAQQPPANRMHIRSPLSVEAEPRLEARKTPRQERGKETVRAILEAASRILETSGAATLTLRELARVSGVSVGSIYQYFPGKDAILVALLDAHLRVCVLAVERTVAEHPEADRAQIADLIASQLVLAHATRPRALAAALDAVPRRTWDERLHEAALGVADDLCKHHHVDVDGADVCDVARAIEAIAHGVMLSPGELTSDRVRRLLALLVDACIPRLPS
jgi:serine/threonine protein kinase/CheY-like chemotaxis protein/AcrR family transcriptional regulator